MLQQTKHLAQPYTCNRKPEEAGIEPAVANYATNGFEDREDHQIPSASID